MNTDVTHEVWTESQAGKLTFAEVVRRLWSFRRVGAGWRIHGGFCHVCDYRIRSVVKMELASK